MRIGTILPFQSLRKLGPTGSTRFIVARKTEISQLRRATIVGDSGSAQWIAQWIKCMNDPS
jgi:hypothetical protein